MIEVRNGTVISAPVERVWDLLTDVECWPSWYRACRWVRVESTGAAASTGGSRVLSVKANPVVRSSTVLAPDRPHSFAFVADAPRLHAEREQTKREADSAIRADNGGVSQSKSGGTQSLGN